MKNSIINLFAICFVFLACTVATLAQTAPPVNGGGNVMGKNDDAAMEWKKKVNGIDWNREIWMQETKMAAEEANPTGDNAKIAATANQFGMPTKAQAIEFMNGLFVPTGNVEQDLQAYEAAKKVFFDNYFAQYTQQLQNMTTVDTTGNYIRLNVSSGNVRPDPNPPVQ